MKILLISGSPHKRGTTSVLIDAFLRGAEESGHEVYHFNAAEKEVHPCIACGRCRSAVASCVFRDDFDDVRDKVLEADAVVFASPVYYFGLSAQIKAVIDRFYAINGDLLNLYKKTALILAFGDTMTETGEYAAASFYGMADYLGWEIVDVVGAKGCYTPEDLEGTDFPKKAYELGKKILGCEVPEETKTAATSLEDLVARLAGFSDIAEEVIKETQEKEGFLEGYND